jgi:hypothetical protein
VLAKEEVLLNASFSFFFPKGPSQLSIFVSEYLALIFGVSLLLKSKGRCRDGHGLNSHGHG